MRNLVCTATTMLALVACGPTSSQSPAPSASGSGAEVSTGSEPSSESAAPAAPASEAAPAGGENEFVLQKSAKSKDSDKQSPSKIKPTATEAAMKFVVVDKETGPIPGVVVLLTAPDGVRYYTEETDASGYTEVLVPVGKKYELSYLSLGRRDIAANVTVTDELYQNVKLTLRYKRFVPPPRPARPATATPAAAPESAPRFLLTGVTFDTGKASIRAESFPRLDTVVEFMTYKKSARIEISGHTDNVGNPKANKALSEKRAQACRDYLISKGIDGSRVQAIGYGDEWPIATNDTEAGRNENRRIEAAEIQ